MHVAGIGGNGEASDCPGPGHGSADCKYALVCVGTAPGPAAAQPCNHTSLSATIRGSEEPSTVYGNPRRRDSGRGHLSRVMVYRLGNKMRHEISVFSRVGRKKQRSIKAADSAHGR